MNAKSKRSAMRMALAAGVFGAIGFASGAAGAAIRIDGQVQAGGGPVANSIVTLWAASGGDPQQLAQAKTADDGSFALGADATPGPGESLYLVAKGGVAAVNKSAGDNPALAFLTVLGGTPPAQCHHQRDDDHRFGLDQRAVPRRDCDQRSRAESQHRRRQRAQLRRSLDRRLWCYDCGRSEQHADADARQFRHAGGCAGRMRDASEGRCVRQPLRRRHGAGRQDPDRHTGGGRVHRTIPVASARKSLRSAGKLLPHACGQASCSGRRLSCRI